MAQRDANKVLLGSFGSRISVVRRHLRPRSHMHWPGFGPRVEPAAAGWTVAGCSWRG